MVIATQNPIEMEGTYPLPEAQRDRFMARVSMGYPVPRAELAMLDSHAAANPLDDLEPVTDAAEIAKLIEIVRTVHVSDAVKQYAVDLDVGDPPLPRPAARRLTARDPAPGPRGAGARGASTTATTCSPTTCRRSPCPCSPTGCSPAEAQIGGRGADAGGRPRAASRSRCPRARPPRAPRAEADRDARSALRL